MGNIFYTYVWGRFGAKAAPLTFTNKQNRTAAQHSAEVGDVVFGVVSRNPIDPQVIISDADKGRVVSAWQISHVTADTAAYGIESHNTWDRREDGAYRWPYALQPLRGWTIRDAPEFRTLHGYTSETHTQRAITTIQQVDSELGKALEDLLASEGEELPIMMPRSAALSGRIRQLQQRHPYALQPYSVTPDSDALHYIYIATLERNAGVIKVGHAQDAAERVRAFNKFRLAEEPQWILHTAQPIGKVQEAIEVERHLGKVFARYRTEPDNNEIYRGISAMEVLSALATLRR